MGADSSRFHWARNALAGDQDEELVRADVRRSIRRSGAELFVLTPRIGRGLVSDGELDGERDGMLIGAVGPFRKNVPSVSSNETRLLCTDSMLV